MAQAQTAKQNAPTPAAQTQVATPAKVDENAGIEVANERQLPALVQKMAADVDMLPKQYFNTMIATAGLAKANFAQQIAFLLTARKYDLDPMVKQISAFEKGGKIFPMVQIDGWTKIINDQKEYDGVEFTDIFGSPTEDGKTAIFAIKCKIYRKDRKFPTEVTEYYSECFMGSSEPWKKWPVRMLRHKALIQCARYAFGLGGIYDPDEIERIKRGETPAEVTQNVDQHMRDIGADGDVPNVASEQEGQFTEVNTAAPDETPADPPSDWEAIFDELEPGVSGCKTLLDLNVFIEENSDIIEKMGVMAPRKIVERWQKLVTAKQEGFKKG